MFDNLKITDFNTVGGLIVIGAAIILAFLWMLLPLFLFRRLARVEKVLRQIESNTRAKEAEPAEPARKLL